MRIVFSKNRCVDEIMSLSVTPVWNGSETTKDIPIMYSVEYFAPAHNGFEWLLLGSYLLDGTMETYQKAVDNFEFILHHIAVHGYVYDHQFENFEFY